MIVDFIPFQQKAIAEIRRKTARAMQSYQEDGTLQVVSYTAPTGAGKTIIMASVMEHIFRGDENFEAEEDAIIVWLSDSPELNQQSKDKIDAKADRILLTQTKTITEEGFNQETLSDGMVYFLNTQKLSKTSNLTRHSDRRQYTIWETLANTVREKGNRLYFIIDEAHRGMRDNQAARATTIMQKFLKGSEEDHLPAMPVVIGITATPERFNALVSGLTDTTTQRVTTTAEEVRVSGLLKDRIIIEYPDALNNEMAVLQAAADEWKDKVLHWEQYCREQHYANVCPVFVVQVQNGSGSNLSDTDLDECLRKIQERTGMTFKEGEVVHTFGQTVGDIVVCGLKVRHEEPSRISDDRNIKVVLFKENLSTGWDCPRAETMMSFRKANDATYIAQLLGRMVRTPMCMHINVDESLNEVRLFLPYFDEQTVARVVEQIQSEEGGNIPTEVWGQAIGEKKIETLSVRKAHKMAASTTTYSTAPETNTHSYSNTSAISVSQPSRIDTGSNDEAQVVPTPLKPQDFEEGQEAETDEYVDAELNREEIIEAINAKGLLSFDVRTVKINNYLKSLLELSRLLSQTKLEVSCQKQVVGQVVGIMRNYVEQLHKADMYDSMAKSVMQFKLKTQTIDVYGNKITNTEMGDSCATTDADIDRQYRLAEAKLGNDGLANKYGKRYYDADDANRYKIDVILFASDTDCLNTLDAYAKKEFHRLQDAYRLKAISLSETNRKRFNDIVSNGDKVSEHSFLLPLSITAIRDADGDRYENHLYLNGNGEAWIKLNNWERGVLMEETAQPDFVCWLRNLPRKPWALTIPYLMDGQTKPAYPDFIIIRKDLEGDYIVDVLEPHDPSRNDNLPKAKGFAEYAKKNPAVGRLQLIRATGNIQGQRFKRLDLTKSLVIEMVLKANTNDDLNSIFDTAGE